MFLMEYHFKTAKLQNIHVLAVSVLDINGSQQPLYCLDMIIVQSGRPAVFSRRSPLDHTTSCHANWVYSLYLQRAW